MITDEIVAHGEKSGLTSSVIEHPRGVSKAPSRCAGPPRFVSQKRDQVRHLVPTLTVKRFRDGERVPMLLDACGIPLFYPTLFATSQLRNAGAAVNTIKNKLVDIAVLLRWESDQGRNLAEEFSNSRFLTLADISALRDFAQLDMRELNKVQRRGGCRVNSPCEILEAHVAFVGQYRTVSTQQHYNRMSTIADYLEFVGSVVTQHKKSSGDVSDVACMAKRIRQHRPRGYAHACVNDLHRKSPSSELVDRFMAVAQVDHPDNPFRDRTVRLRNAILFGLLRFTGIRRGELLGLRIDQFDLGNEPLVWVRRNHDDVHDTRCYQPVAKTKERPLPLPRTLADQIQDYILHVRAKISVARRHPYLFVSHKNGRTCGQPLSETALGSQIMTAMRAVDPEFQDIHPHALRHYFNYELSRHIDDVNEAARKQPGNPSLRLISASQELDIRAFANGHQSKSSGAVYNQRHVRELADHAVRKIQSGMTSSTSEKDDDAA
ncbi:site-specific integrase [Dyella sp.]|uniref:site-specific integrase n=1 Tax=Dyella sp. TaxID=1869338 RepID=UPI002D77CF74|nr:site-specific integrase [Dyella sp.]HET7332904.1 site-specific integrase [Dyella sp.]